MSLKFGTRTIPSIYEGNRRIGQIFEGTRKIYPSGGGTDPTATIIAGQLPSNTTTCGYLGASPNSEYIGLVNNSSPYFRIWKRATPTSFSILNFPYNLGGSARGIAFTNDKVFLGNSKAPFLYCYAINGTTITEVPGYSVDFNTRAIAISPDGQYMGVGGVSGPGNFRIFKNVNGTFTDLVTLNATSFKGTTWATWDSTSTYLAITSDYSSSNVMIYKRVGDTFTAISPITSTVTGCQACEFMGGNTRLVISGTGGTFYQLISFENDTIAQNCTVTTVSPAEASLALAVDPTGTYASIGTPNAKGLRFFKLEFNTLAEYATSYNAGQEGRSVVWSKDNTYISSGGTPNLAKVT